jgi:hypothetical protein
VKFDYLENYDLFDYLEMLTSEICRRNLFRLIFGGLDLIYLDILIIFILIKFIFSLLARVKSICEID